MFEFTKIYHDNTAPIIATKAAITAMLAFPNITKRRQSWYSPHFEHLFALASINDMQATNLESNFSLLGIFGNDLISANNPKL